jgi:hypothetical protein
VWSILGGDRQGVYVYVYVCALCGFACVCGYAYMYAWQTKHDTHKHIYTHTQIYIHANMFTQCMQGLLDGAKTPDGTVPDGKTPEEKNKTPKPTAEALQEKHDSAVREEQTCLYEIEILEDQLKQLDWEKELELLQSEGRRLEEEALASLEDAKLAHAADPTDQTQAEVCMYSMYVRVCAHTGARAV